MAYAPNRRGFALPMVIMVVVVLTTALTAAFVATTSEATANVTLRGQDRAFMIAQMGLERFLAEPDPLALCSTCDTLRTTPAVDHFAKDIDGDSVYITVTRVRHQSSPTMPALYFVQARAVDKTSKLAGRLADVDARRSVGMYVQWQVNTMQVLSAWTSLTGLKKQGSSGLLSGVDQCGKRPDVAGTTVPKGELHYSGNSNWAQGSPKIDTLKTAHQLMATMKIDWDAVVNHDAIEADFTVPEDEFPSLAWFDADTSRWPTIRVKASDYALPTRGRGVLIIDGNLTISGSDMWEGVILVGGKLISNGSNTVAGAVVTGLNVLLPGATPPSKSELDDSQANGQKTYVYNSCKVARATRRLEQYRALSNTWVDNLPTW